MGSSHHELGPLHGLQHGGNRHGNEPFRIEGQRERSPAPPTRGRIAEADPMEAGMPLGETAREILEFFRETHRKPGARMTMATLDAHYGTDPAVAVAISELKRT